MPEYVVKLQSLAGGLGGLNVSLPEKDTNRERGEWRRVFKLGDVSKTSIERMVKHVFKHSTDNQHYSPEISSTRPTLASAARCAGTGSIDRYGVNIPTIL
jgi:hypothetical protein